MQDKSNALLLGNGLNRTINDGISWAELLGRLDGSLVLDNNDQAPFPLLFERIAARRGLRPDQRTSNAFKKLKYEVAEEIASHLEEPADLHRLFASLPFDCFITTNYDTCFENSFMDRELLLKNPGSTRNILKPVINANKKPLYYAHGCVKWTNTMCLGYEHYISLITKIKNEIYPKNAKDEHEDWSHLVALAQGTTPAELWPELLITSNIYIVGLGLEYSEIDLWWLLSLRSSLFAECNHLSSYVNTVTYYEVMLESQIPSESSRLQMMGDLGVEVQRIRAASYEEGYRKIAHLIEGRIS